MTSLPVDLLPTFLCSLDNSDLEKCCLVTRSFYHVAWPLLFAHIVLSSRTWKAKCRHLLDTRDSHLLKHTKGLTLEVTGMPVFIQDTANLPLLVSLLQRFQGQPLESFCMDTHTEERSWPDLSPIFQDVLSASILPFISSLQLLGIAWIPLPTVLAQCSLLQNLRMGAKFIGIGDDDVMSWEETPALPSVRLLSFEMFGKPDFEDGTSLARYMQLEDNKIEYLEFKENFSPNTFPVSLSFLEPFATLRQHLLHLSFGPRLHRTIVTRDGKYGTLPLGMFPQLQTVQFAISALRDKTNTDTWTPWSNWLASMLTSENDWIHSLKILRLLMEPDLVQRPTTTLDRLSGSMNIQIHVCVDGNGNNADLFEHTVVSVRSSLPAWDEANKLKCWMRLGE